MSDMVHLVDLTSRRLGGGVIAASDETFGAKEHLLTPSAPISYAAHTGLSGELYDGWETRRRRHPGDDWAIVRLGAPGVAKEIVVDTRFFRGNCPKACTIEGCGVEGYLTAEELAARQDLGWTTLLPRTPLNPDSENRFPVRLEQRFTHVRLTVHPDGGVARLRVLGEVVPDPRRLTGVSLDLAAQSNGGVVLDCSDQFFGNPFNINAPTPMLRAEKGWESTRRRGHGHDWIVLRLAGRGTVRQIEYDTTYYRGNAPEKLRLLGSDAARADLTNPDSWFELLPSTTGLHDTVHWFPALAQCPVTHVRLETYPDGGVSRLRLYGELDPEGRETVGIHWLDTLPSSNAIAILNALGFDPESAAAVARARPLRRATAVLAVLDELPRVPANAANALLLLIGRDAA